MFRLRNSFPFGACVVEDLRIRNYARTAVECSVHLVAELAKYFNKPPEQLGKEGDPLVVGKDTGIALNFSLIPSESRTQS